jgi:hypothetical protein
MTKKLYQGNVSQPVTQDSYCGDPEGEVFFTAPIDLLPDDKVMIDWGSGQPLAVYRDNRKIWEFQGHYVSGSFSMTGTVDHDVLAHLLGGADK